MKVNESATNGKKKGKQGRNEQQKNGKRGGNERQKTANKAAINGNKQQ